MRLACAQGCFRRRVGSGTMAFWVAWTVSGANLENLFA